MSMTLSDIINEELADAQKYLSVVTSATDKNYLDLIDTKTGNCLDTFTNDMDAAWFHIEYCLNDLFDKQYNIKK